MVLKLHTLDRFGLHPQNGMDSLVTGFTTIPRQGRYTQPLQSTPGGTGLNPVLDRVLHHVGHVTVVRNGGRPASVKGFPHDKAVALVDRALVIVAVVLIKDTMCRACRGRLVPHQVLFGAVDAVLLIVVGLSDALDDPGGWFSHRKPNATFPGTGAVAGFEICCAYRHGGRSNGLLIVAKVSSGHD